MAFGACSDSRPVKPLIPMVGRDIDALSRACHTRLDSTMTNDQDSDDHDDEKPVRKKRRLSTGCGTESGEDSMSCIQDYGEHFEPSMQKILEEEIDLEISIRQRMTSMIESRIALALLLRDSLSNSVPSKLAVSYIIDIYSFHSLRDRCLIQLQGHCP